MKPMTFRVTVKNVAVREKIEKDDDFTTTRKIGRLTLEFDGDSVDAGKIVDYINGEHVLLGLADSQTQLPGFATS